MFLFLSRFCFFFFFFFFWLSFSINFAVKIVSCKQYSLNNLNQGILVSLVCSDWLQCSLLRPGIWSDIKNIIYFLAKTEGLVHVILHLKPGKRWNLSTDGGHGYIEGEKNVLCHMILYDTIHLIVFKIRHLTSAKEREGKKQKKKIVLLI